MSSASPAPRSSVRFGLRLIASALLSVSLIFTLACETSSGGSDDAGIEGSGADTSPDTTTEADTSVPTGPFTVSPPSTSVEFGAQRNAQGIDDFRALLCLVADRDPAAGVVLGGSTCSGSGDVVLGFDVLGGDRNLVYVTGGGGVFTIASGTSGASGEGPFPGTTAWRMPMGTSSDFVLNSVVLRQTRYRAELTATVTDGPLTLTIDDVTFTPLP